MSESDYNNPDEWELVNDDGFVYKRKKRARVDPTSLGPPVPDPALERRHRLERKKRALLKLRDKYAKEITQWELLSSSLKAMEVSAAAAAAGEEEPVEVCSATTSCGGEPGDEEGCSESGLGRRRVVDELLVQVEAQEAIIRDGSNLCDVAEALCSAKEERLKLQFTDLPIWEPSPQELMAALSEP